MTLWAGLHTERRLKDPYHQHAYRQHKRGTVVLMIYHIISLFGRGFTQKGALKNHAISMHIDNSREELLLYYIHVPINDLYAIQAYE